MKNDIGGAEFGLMKITPRRVMSHGLEAEPGYESIMEDMGRQPLQMEIKDN
jgi:hypothetical protein